MGSNGFGNTFVSGRSRVPKPAPSTSALRTRAIINKWELVYRLAYSGDVAAGQLAVFQGASEAPISESYGSSEQRGKTANWPRPRGLRGKWAGGCVARRSRIGSDRLPPRALPTAHFDRNNIPLISGTGH